MSNPPASGRLEMRTSADKPRPHLRRCLPTMRTARRRPARPWERADDVPDDLLDLIKTDPGAPFEHAAALAKMRAKLPPDWARVKAALKGAKVSIGDLERAMGTGEGGDGKPGRPRRME